MRKIIIVLMLTMWISGFAQDPEMIGTWYLRAFTVDLGDPILITPEDAPQNPTLIIYSDYSFEGIGACNTFTGQFEYDAAEEVYFHTIFEATTNDCGDPGYNIFENNYFSYFNDVQGPLLRYVPIGSGLLSLEIDSPGFGMEFQDTPFLGIEENRLELINIHPTITSDYIVITRPVSAEVEKVMIYNSQGKLVAIETENLHQLDVSALSGGVYFLQIDSKQGRITKKFIKR